MIDPKRLEQERFPLFRILLHQLATGETPMARKPVSSDAEKPAAKPDPRRAVVDALFRLAATQGWDEIELPAIAREAGISLAELRNLFPSKLAILGGLIGRILDDAVLAGSSDDLHGGIL
jgi:AcrR family transcriptional regulator